MIWWCDNCKEYIGGYDYTNHECVIYHNEYDIGNNWKDNDDFFVTSKDGTHIFNESILKARENHAEFFKRLDNLLLMYKK